MTTEQRQRGSPPWYHACFVRAASVPIHAVMFGIAALLASGCAAARHETPIGMSDAEPEPARALQVAKKPMGWPDFTAARAWPEAAPPSIALVHRRDGTLIHVRVEPHALAAYRALSAEAVMPDGARVVAWHEAPGGALLGGYLLEKHAGVWSAKQLDADGALVPGDRAPCVRCHDMAPTDHLFGVPSAALPPPTNGESIISAPR